MTIGIHFKILFFLSCFNSITSYSIYGSDEKSSTSRVNSAYTSLREPLELPCRFSYTVLIKLVNILRRLIRLAVFLSAATSALTSNNIVSSEFPFNSDLSTSFFADKLSGTEDFVRINAANSVSNLSPLSLHSQLIVTMQRLEFMTVSLQAPLCPFSSCNQSVDNPVLEGYIEKYMNAQPQLSHFAAAQFSPAFLMMHLRSRLFDTIFVNVSPDLKSCPALNKRVVACTVAAAVEELYPLELQRLALCSEAHAKPIAGRVNGIRWAKGNLKSQNKQTALSVIDSVMTQLIRTTVSEIEQVAFSQSPCPTSARFIFVATEGVLVSLKVPLHCRSDNISCKDSSMQKGLHFAAVAEAASSRYMETDKCVRNKLKIANYLATVNDIYAKPSKIGFEFNAGVSRSHQVAAPILPEAYNECDGLNEYPPDEHCVLRGRIDKMFCINDSSICNSDLLITCISSPDYTTAESDVDICISRPLTTRGPIDTASHNLTAPLDLLPISVAKSQAALPHEHEGHFAHPQTPRVKKSDVAVPVAITFKASQGSDSFAQSRSRSQFDMKILIPRTIRNAFSYSPRDLNTLGLVDDVKSAQINTGGRQLDLSQSRKADWDKLFRALVEKDSSYSESAVSTTQSIKIIVPTAISESQSQRIVRIFPKGRLDALYDSFRFEILFIRLHAQVRQLSNPDAIALYASPVYASGLAPGSDCSRQFDRFIGLSNACSTSVGLLEVCACAALKICFISHCFTGECFIVG